MRIIGISGAWSINNPIWSLLGPAFIQQFKGQFVVEEEHNCHPWHIARLSHFAKKIVRGYDDGAQTLLVGHSMGGLVACSIANKFKKSHVCGVVTICTPHQFPNRLFAHMFGAGTKVNAPIVSFGAKNDEVVWWGAAHPQARRHITINSDHFFALADDHQLAHSIAQQSKNILFP